jgi:glycosyltransferase involved in cell wall biosynthesis
MMRIAMTLMVRDEADVIDAMLRHHAAHGIDIFIVTDNGSTDGTLELIEAFAQEHDLDLRHDPVHRKQQSSVVTRMARDAATTHGADWVINADADEFWMPSGTEGLRQALSQIPADIVAFQVPVIDMTGEPAESGTGLDRLVWRDGRPTESLLRAGLRAHSSPDAVHRGDPDIVVAQGNHEVNRPAKPLPGASSGIEVLHLPWRSWDQFRRKVDNAGRSYLANSELHPSPNHHGMKDFSRMLEGSLRAAYVARHPSAGELREGIKAGWFVRDERLASSDLPRHPDVALDGVEELRAQGRALVQREAQFEKERDAARNEADNARNEADNARNEAENARNEAEELRRQIDSLRAQFDAHSEELRELRARRLVRLSDRLARVTRRGEGR